MPDHIPAVDPRVRSLVRPQRIVWVSENDNRRTVADADTLLQERYGQVPEGVFLEGSGCRLENKGAAPGVLLDFGTELHGGVRLASGGPSGRDVRVRVRFGESVSEAMADLGERGACNDHAIRDSVVDLPWCGTREFGYSGFRFCRVDLVSEGILSLESVDAVSLMRPMERRGYFCCNDERLNRIWSTAAHTIHLCCQDFIWDGIKRDRLVWMGDMHPEMMALLAVFGEQDVLTRSLDYMRDITPCDAYMNGMPSYTLWWIRCLHDLFQYNGTLAYVRSHHAYLQRVVDNLETGIGEDNRCKLKGFLDWPTQHNPAAVLAGMQALMLMAFENAGTLAEALGDSDLTDRCQACAARLRKAVPDPEGSKTAAALLALSGVRPIQAMHRQILSQNGMAGLSTFYGYYVLEAMARAGDVAGGLEILRRYWGGMLDMGATSFWEGFDLEWTRNAFRVDELPVSGKDDIHGDFGEFCYKGFRHSLCHGWASGPAPWLQHHVLGVQIAEVGYRAVRVQPSLGDLTWAEGALPTPHGNITVRHEVSAGGTIHSECQAPTGIQILMDESTR